MAAAYAAHPERFRGMSGYVRISQKHPARGCGDRSQAAMAVKQLAAAPSVWYALARDDRVLAGCGMAQQRGLTLSVAPSSENGCIRMLMRSVRASLMHPPRAAGSRQPICSARATMMPAGPRR